MSELLLFPAPTRPSSSHDPGPATFEGTRMLRDPEARQAALDIRQSWIVEAPAGSGKTGLLIQRYLKLLAHGEVHRPGDVLVLTFTRKADGELRDRVLKELGEARDGVPLAPTAGSFERETRAFAEAVLARDRKLGWHVLESPTQLNIRTIDSFCAELATSTPLLAARSARFPPAEDAFPLYRTAAERTVSALGGPDAALNRALEDLLIHRDAEVQDCLDLIATMLAQREQWGELIPLRDVELTDEYLDNVVRPRLERTLAQIVSAGLQRATQALGSTFMGELAHFANRISTEPGYNGQPNPLAHCANLHGAVPADAAFLPHWTAVADLLLTQQDEWRKKPNRKHVGIDLPKTELQSLENLLASLKDREESQPDLVGALAAVRTLPPSRYPEEQWPLIKHLCRILRHALGELQQVFRERGQTDFAEVALAARHLLRPDPTDAGPFSPDPLSTPAARLKHLLVDEMQDTSAGQYQLLEALTHTWDGASQTVFLVGDPKQSIYAFRQARVERFLRTMDSGRLGDLPLGSLRLTANFRSQAALVAAFNESFREIFPGTANVPPQDASENGAQNASAVPFVEAVAARGMTHTPALHWHAYLKSDPDSAEATLDSNRSRDLRSVIECFLESWPNRTTSQGEKVRAPKIAVLARNRAHLAPIIAELRGKNGKTAIPFRAVDVESLQERPEVLDLLALTRALVHPADRVAWLAVLRSPMCGLTRADLLILTGEGPDADREATMTNLVERHASLLSTDGQTLLARTWPILLEAERTLGRTPLSTHVERTWRSLGGDAPLTRDQHTNAIRFLDLLAKIEVGPEPLSLPLLQSRLRKLYAEPISGNPPVELMTIHKAKGLEWDLVLVPSLERGSGRNPHGLLKWLEIDSPLAADTAAEFLLAPIHGKGGKQSALSGWLAKGEQLREAAEAQRLLYVACTRAREELHLFGSVERQKDGSLCKPRNQDSLLRAAWPVAKPVFDRQLTIPTETSNVIELSHRDSEPIAIAAAAELISFPAATAERRPILLQRLPATYQPEVRFRADMGAQLPYAPVTELPHAAAFSRPEGSFAARAFGNTVHRFLQLLATRVAAGEELGELQARLPGWLPRLTAALRNEGLPPNLAANHSQRALAALTATLQHPEGAWLLAPHPDARNEAPVAPGAHLRADRSFLAGPEPLSRAETHRWIVDYKTAELGGRSQAAFFSEQKLKYLPQMTAYAEANVAAGISPDTLVLALFFPLVPALVYWKFHEELSANNVTSVPLP